MASVLEKSEVTVRSKLSILRRLCDEKIEAHQQKIDSVSVSLKKFLQSHKSNSESSAQNQGFILCIHSFSFNELKLFIRIVLLGFCICVY